MRRIYESRALRRDDDDPFVPNESDDEDYRSVNWRKASHAFLPTGLRARAIEVSVETDHEVYAPDQPVNFFVEFRNRFPTPISIPTTSPVPWTWDVNGLEQASKVDDDVPERADLFEFSRGERKQFSRRWTQRVRESESEWSVADPGEYTLTVSINAKRDADRLRDSVTFRIE